MIIIYHSHNKVDAVWNHTESVDIPLSSPIIVEQLLAIAQAYPKVLLVWCHTTLKDHLQTDVLKNIFQHKKLLVSYNTTDTPYLGHTIGYINASPFIKIKKNVLYPTWLMSSDVGGVYAGVVLAVKSDLKLEVNFDYFLNSLAKLAMPLGLFCYSAPKLLKSNTCRIDKPSSYAILFRFVKEHYKAVWIFLLFLNLALYERQFPFLALLRSLFYKRKQMNLHNLESLPMWIPKKSDSNSIEFDVIIPTIGRKKYLLDFLKSLAAQSTWPKQVIVVEQNPDLSKKSELDYLQNEHWPFKIKHHFIHQTGACNARNIALRQVESDWVFLADDDILIGSDFILKATNIIKNTSYKAFTFCCYMSGKKPADSSIKQWEAFGSGCSMVKKEILKGCFFSGSYEHGFGEDTDFGMQLRDKGHDVIYLPEPAILHLKAPMGGFRTKPKLLWETEAVQPKPSPTIMLYQLLHKTKEQQLGYKTLLFLKYYKNQSIKNPFKYFNTFKKQWHQSLRYANQLKNNNPK